MIKKTLRLFLDGIGRREEYEFYLQKFRTGEDTPFALLCPISEGFENVAEVLRFDLSFLVRLELFPAVVLCGEHAPKMSQLLQAEDHPFQEMEIRNLPNEPELGEIRQFLAGCRSDGKVGILVFPEHEQTQILCSLVPTISSRIQLTRAEGPIRSTDGDALPYYYTVKANANGVATQDRPLAEAAGKILSEHPGIHISITSTWKLLEELFTVKGAGCIVRRGSIIHHFKTATEIDSGKLATLILESFNRPASSMTYVPKVAEAYIEEKYAGAILLEQHEAGMYMSKFAVGTQARGEGLAHELWNEAAKDHSALFWRSREQNPINRWYGQLADGVHRHGGWRIFWRGVDPNKLPSIIAFCSSRSDDFRA